MKTLFATVGLGAALISLTACGGGTGFCPTTEGSQGTFSALIDGETYESCLTTTSRVAANEDGANVITGLAYKMSIPPLPLQIVITSRATAPGTYPLGEGDDQGTVIDSEVSSDESDGYSTDDAPEGAETGAVTVSRYDDDGWAGTFSFTAYNPDGEAIEITEGTFDASWAASGLPDS